LLHAKSGVLAGVFLVGTTGALVTATVQNGVTTITLTEASPSPSASASASPTASPPASPTASPSASPSASAGACADQAHAASNAVKTVNSAFARFHGDLSHRREGVRSDSARQTIENADKLLKQIREN